MGNVGQDAPPASHTTTSDRCWVVDIRQALPDDAAACIQMRGMTRENAISAEQLQAHGITVHGWAQDIRTGTLVGHVCHEGSELQGYVFGDMRSGEVVVLALRPAAESQGLGRRLLALMVRDLRGCGHSRLFLGCSPETSNRSHGFYRHLGWRSTGTFDEAGDEVLELLV